MGNLIRMDLYRMHKNKGFKVCLILAFVCSLASTPLMKLLVFLASKLSADGSASLFPETVKLSDLIGSPFSLASILLILLSAVIFFYADMENGYIKNIAGQMPKRGFSILSRYLAAIVHNGVFMAVCLIGSIAGSLLSQKIVVDGGGIASGLLTFILKWLLLQSLCAILMLVTSSFRSKSFGMILAVLFGVTATNLLYGAIDSGLGMIFDRSFSITPYMPDTLLFEEHPEVLRSILSAAVTIGIFLPASISIFDKKDVK